MTEQGAVPPQAIAFWRALLGQEEQPAPDWPGREGWIAALSPALVSDLAPHLPLDEEWLQKSRLFGRFQQALQLQALTWIADANINVVALKGFAAAFLYYPSPASRLLGDLDLLVRAQDAPFLARALQAHGFRFGAAIRRPWGFLSDASFMPLHSADGNCNVDIHVKPDSWPLSLGLETETVLAQARQVMAVDREVALPCAEHMALILISNLAKDKFSPDGLRKLLDLARLLMAEHDFPWGALIARARQARMGKALETACALLRALGTPDEFIHPTLGHRRSSALERLARDWCRPQPSGLLRRLEREWLLAAEADVAARLMLRRGLGLFHSRSGMPDAT